MKETWANRIVKLLGKIQPSETMVFGGAAVLVGLAGGVGVWLFKALISIFNKTFFGTFLPTMAPLGSWTILLLPLVGGIIVGLLMHIFVGVEKHHGVAGIMEAVALGGGRLRYRRMPIKSLAAAISIGSGASVGPEDPSVQIGANIGSLLGQWIRASEERVRMLVASGAAAGIAAAFNAPIAGVFFALEIILGEISGGAFASVVIAAVTSAVFTQAVAGKEPAFHVPAYAFNSEWELPLYLALGLLAGPIAALYVRALYFSQDFFHAINLPRWLKTGLAGAMVGLAGIFVPQALGIGYDTIGAVLQGQEIGMMLLITLLAAKLILTAISIGGGFPGGVFAPSLFLGAMLGGAFGYAAQAAFPGLPIDPPAYAMVGMAAMLAGAVHAPLTAIILLFEMTNDYRIILPLMFAVIVSLLISQRIQRDSVYVMGLARKGIRLERGRDVDVLEHLSVEEVMSRDYARLRENDLLETAAALMIEKHSHGLPVLDDQNNLTGILTTEDIEKANSSDHAKRTVGESCSRDLVVAYPDESIGTALRHMAVRDIGRVPVVARSDPRHLLGMLRRSDIFRAYDVAITRRSSLLNKAHQARLGALRGEETSILEYRVEPGSMIVGKRIKEISWPEDSIIASLRRGRRLVIPHGETVIQAGDLLVAVVEGEARSQMAALCKQFKSQ